MATRFNEAAGFTRRKLLGWPAVGRAPGCFNEAAGFTRRKRVARYVHHAAGAAGFNEAAGFTRRKPDR